MDQSERVGDRASRVHLSSAQTSFADSGFSANGLVESPDVPRNTKALRHLSKHKSVDGCMKECSSKVDFLI